MEFFTFNFAATLVVICAGLILTGTDGIPGPLKNVLSYMVQLLRLATGAPKVGSALKFEMPAARKMESVICTLSLKQSTP